MKKTIFKGSGVAVITPMEEDGSINYSELRNILDYQISKKTDAIIVAGTTGEGSTLTDDEHIELIKYSVRHVKGRVPVIAGAGSNCTSHAQYLSREAEKAGADALLHVTPYYNKASQRGLFEHFRICAESTSLPIILYNVPSRTGVNIQAETCQKLCQIENITALKEASGNFSQIAKIASLCGDDLHIYSGNDDQITSALVLGAKGVISVLANVVPEETHDICQTFFDGNSSQSDTLQMKYLQLIEALFCDINPIPVKQAMNYIGWEAGECRLPLCDMENSLKEKLYATLNTYGLCEFKPELNFGEGMTIHRPKNVLLWRSNH